MNSKLPDKILCVDIDGVLTSVETGTYFATNPLYYGPSKVIVDKVKKFCKDNDAKVIISSNWRKFEIDGIWKNSYGEFKNPLPKVIEMLGDCYIGTFPIVRHINKSQSMILWIKETNYDGKFVIFDDDPKEDYQNTYDYRIKDCYIHIDPEFGITDEDLAKAKEILKRQ